MTLRESRGLVAMDTEEGTACAWAELGAMVDEASSQWPGLALSKEAFAEYLRPRATASGGRRLRCGDLYLAFGCATGDARALEAFEVEHLTDLRNIIRRFSNLSVSAEDLEQALREKLFVARAGRPAKITEYSGRGRLQNWVRVTALRALIDEARRRAPRIQPRQTEELADVADAVDPELDFLKRHYRAEFERAFTAALETLTSSERNLLRHHLVGGLSVDRIGAISGVHRATAARRIARAREALVVATRRELMARLDVGPADADSIMALVRSNVDLSVRRLLGRRPSSVEEPEARLDGLP